MISFLEQSLTVSNCDQANGTVKKTDVISTSEPKKKKDLGGGADNGDALFIGQDLKFFPYWARFILWV